MRHNEGQGKVQHAPDIVRASTTEPISALRSTVGSLWSAKYQAALEGGHDVLVLISEVWGGLRKLFGRADTMGVDCHPCASKQVQNVRFARREQGLGRADRRGKKSSW